MTAAATITAAAIITTAAVAVVAMMTTTPEGVKSLPRYIVYSKIQIV
jgi:hypothetical protein